MAPNSTGGGAGRIEQDGIKWSGPPFQDVGRHGLRTEREPREIVPQAFEAGWRTVNRDCVRTGQRELCGLAAGRGAEVGDGHSLDVPEKPNRQRGGGILYPPCS